MGGVSSLTSLIIITYLMAFKLKREEFIGSISVIYLFGSIPLYAALALYGRLQWSHFAISMLAMAPIGLGMAIGKTLRDRIREELFRRVLLLFFHNCHWAATEAGLAQRGCIPPCVSKIGDGLN